MFKRVIAAFLVASAPFAGAASAATIGVAFADDDTFLKLLRAGVEDEASKRGGVSLTVEVAGKDADRQMDTLKSFIDQKVDAMIVNLVNSDDGKAVSQMASEAGIPLVYVNTQPINAAELPRRQTFVASDDEKGGTLQAKEACRLLNGKGRIVLMMGELTNPAARRRSDAVAAVAKTEECSGLEIVERQSANWKRDQGTSVMGEWLNADVAFDAVLANNDDMALGALRIMSLRGLPMDEIVVAGIDATPAALTAMKTEELDFTVYQNASAQGAGAIKAAIDLIAGEKVPPAIDIPYELVTPANLANYVE